MRRHPLRPTAGVGDGDRGAATTEMVLVMPVLIAFLFLVILAGRLTDARSDVVTAASDAARVASLQNTLGQAEVQAAAIVEDTLAGEGIECDGDPTVDVQPGPGGFARGEVVHVTVGCRVRASDLALFDLPGTIPVTAEAWEPIDTHGSR